MRPAHRWDDLAAGVVNGATPARRKKTFNALATGDSFSCGVRSDQTVSCWGANGAGAGRATRRGTSLP